MQPNGVLLEEDGSLLESNRFKHLMHLVALDSGFDNSSVKKQGSGAMVSFGTALVLTCPFWLCTSVALYTVLPRAKHIVNRYLLRTSRKWRSAAVPSLLSGSWAGVVAAVLSRAYFALTTALLARRLAYYILPQGTFRKWLLQAIERRVSFTSGDQNHQRYVPRRGSRHEVGAMPANESAVSTSENEIDMATSRALAAAVAMQDSRPVDRHYGSNGPQIKNDEGRVWIPDDQLDYLKKLLAHDEDLKTQEQCTEWAKFVDKSMEGMRVEGYRRESELLGATQYMTRTRLMNITARQMHEFYLDDDYRLKWVINPTPPLFVRG